MKKIAVKQTTVYLPKSAYDQLAILGLEKDLRFPELIRRAAEDYIEKEQGKKIKAHLLRQNLENLVAQD